jgi:hypothetical protein
VLAGSTTNIEGEEGVDAIEEGGVTRLILSIKVVQSPPVGLVASNVNTCVVNVGTKVAVEVIHAVPVTEFTENITFASIFTTKLLATYVGLFMYDHVIV